MFTPNGQEFSFLKPKKPKEETQGKMMLTSSIKAHVVKHHNFIILPSATKYQKAQVHLA
jgi:hypothetical protein